MWNGLPLLFSLYHTYVATYNIDSFELSLSDLLLGYVLSGVRQVSTLVKRLLSQSIT